MDTCHAEQAMGRRAFLRSTTLFGAGLGVTVLAGACSETGDPITSASSTLVSGRKWVRVDSLDTVSGFYMSLDGFSDSAEGALTSDAAMSGHAILPSGEIVPLEASMNQDSANALSLSSLGGGLYRIVSGGVPQPPGAPYEIRLVERTIPGTNVIVLTGYSTDPSTGKRVVFTVTHDPAWWLIAIVVVLVIHFTAQPAWGQGCNESGGVQSLRATVTGTTANTSEGCNHDQGGGG